MRKKNATDEGKEYAKEARKSLRKRYSTAKRWNTTHRKDMDGILNLKEWTLTFDEFQAIVSCNCYYCNRSIADETGSGLDRIDNSKGYVPGNVNPCCADCNRRRGDSMDSETFKEQSKLNGYWIE